MYFMPVGHGRLPNLIKQINGLRKEIPGKNIWTKAEQ